MIIGERCIDQGVWDELVLDHGGHPLQLWGWGELKSAHGWQAHRVVFTDSSGTVVGGAQILVKRLPLLFRRLCYVPRGPVWGRGSQPAVLEALGDYVKHHLPGTVLIVEPDTTDMPALSGWQRSANTILIPRTLILDLTQDEPSLQAAMNKKTRQYIRKSASAGLVVRQVKGKEEIGKCLAIYKQTATRAGFALHGDGYYYDVHHKLGESSVIFAAYSGDTPVAFLWIAVSAQTAFELYGGMNEKGQELRANYMLKWHAITKCQQWGIARYDLNGLLNDGVSTFKQGFASHEDMLAGTYDYPLSWLYPVWTKLLPAIKQILRKLKSLRK